MCGILGHLSKNPINQNLFSAALQLQNHRGPDHQGVAFLNKHRICPREDRAEGELFDGILGHNRLSIIDLTADSHQPMIHEDGQYAIVFNGEIYNYLEIRSDLQGKGIKFHTQGDVEVLLKALIYYGQDVVTKFNGMWAFAFFDLKNNKLHLSRDRFGKKPLYYYYSKNDFIFASECKAIYKILQQPRRLNLNFLVSYLTNNIWPTLPNGETFYEEILQLPAGCSLDFDLNTFLITHSANNTVDQFFSRPDGNRLSQDLTDAVSIRLRSDVPIGIFVSGGVDSTAVASWARQVCADKDQITWLTGNTSYGNDLDHSRNLAKSLGVKLVEVKVNYDTAIMERIKKMTYYYERPLVLMGNSVAMNALYAEVSGLGIKVVLDGTGGDEIFGGYFDYYGAYLLNSMLQHHAYKNLITFLVKSISNGNSYFRPWFKNLYCAFLKNVFNRDWSGKNLFPRMGGPPAPVDPRLNLEEFQTLDIRWGRLPMWLVMNDTNSMMYSIEARNPLLDYRLLKYITLPYHQKFAEGYNKISLRRVLPSSVPSAVRWRSDKQGFRWKNEQFWQTNEQIIQEAIKASPIIAQLININELEQKLDLNHKSQVFLRLYALALLEMTFDIKSI
jgi:asparagine synthase (glutamine-hydrolysing)